MVRFLVKYMVDGCLISESINAWNFLAFKRNCAPSQDWFSGFVFLTLPRSVFTLYWWIGSLSRHSSLLPPFIDHEVKYLIAIRAPRSAHCLEFEPFNSVTIIKRECFITHFSSSTLSLPHPPIIPSINLSSWLSRSRSLSSFSLVSCNQSHPSYECRNIERRINLHQAHNQKSGTD